MYLCFIDMKVISKIGLVFIFSLFLFIDIKAQCSMCKAVVESGIDDSGRLIGAGINKGIYFLMGIPYLLLIILAITFYKNMKYTERE